MCYQRWQRYDLTCPLSYPKTLISVNECRREEEQIPTINEDLEVTVMEELLELLTHSLMSSIIECILNIMCRTLQSVGNLMMERAKVPSLLLPLSKHANQKE